MNMIKNNNEDNKKMSPLMKTVKAAHDRMGIPDTADMEEVEKHRKSEEAIAKIATPSLHTGFDKFYIEELESQWTHPRQESLKYPVILYCHGGGFSSGGLEYAGVLAGKLTKYTGMSVLSYAYRLTPEFPYPAALEDTVKAWDYLRGLGYEAEDIILAGDSAGGNLALELTLFLKEQDKPLPRALILMSPWTDMTATAPSYEKYADFDPILSYEYIVSARNAYLPETTDYENPKYSPLFADLSGFPPVLIQVGSHEILRSDSEHLCQKLQKNGSQASIEIFKDCWHVFQQMPTIKAVKAMEDIAAFIDSIR